MKATDAFSCSRVLWKRWCLAMKLFIGLSKFGHFHDHSFGWPPCEDKQFGGLENGHISSGRHFRQMTKVGN